LAATATEYLPNFYGQMGDSINGTDGSDPLLVTWQLATPEVVVAACAGRPADPDATGAMVGLAADGAGAPVVGRLDAARIRVAVPTDIEQLRHTDPAARQWRAALREVLGGLIAAGGRIAGFFRQGWYLVERA
jgi:predicted GNAT superfamily acetyltransferase